MLVERSYLEAKDGEADAFDALLATRAVPLLKGIEGARDVRFGRGVENPDIFILLIEWADMDAHTAFTRQPVFAEFRAMLTPYTRGGRMEHFEMR